MKKSNLALLAAICLAALVTSCKGGSSSWEGIERFCWKGEADGQDVTLWVARRTADSLLVGEIKIGDKTEFFDGMSWAPEDIFAQPVNSENNTYEETGISGAIEGDMFKGSYGEIDLELTAADFPKVENPFSPISAKDLKGLTRYSFTDSYFGISGFLEVCGDGSGYNFQVSKNDCQNCGEFTTTEPVKAAKNVLSAERNGYGCKVELFKKFAIVTTTLPEKEPVEEDDEEGDGEGDVMDFEESHSFIHGVYFFESSSNEKADLRSGLVDKIELENEYSDGTRQTSTYQYFYDWKGGLVKVTKNGEDYATIHRNGTHHLFVCGEEMTDYQVYDGFLEAEHLDPQTGKGYASEYYYFTEEGKLENIEWQEMDLAEQFAWENGNLTLVTTYDTDVILRSEYTTYTEEADNINLDLTEAAVSGNPDISAITGNSFLRCKNFPTVITTTIQEDGEEETANGKEEFTYEFDSEGRPTVLGSVISNLDAETTDKAVAKISYRK